MMREKIPDKNKAISLILCSKHDINYTLSLEVNKNSTNTIVRNIYESFRMLGEASLVNRGIGSPDHATCINELFKLDVKTLRPLQIIDGLRKLRHNINYYGYISSISEAEDAISIAKSCFNSLFAEIDKIIGRIKQKRVYLTIDDSPSENTMEKIDFLFDKKIPAFLFCIGKMLEKNPEPIIHAIKRGFIIGNHSYSHTHFSEIPLESAYFEIEKGDKVIEEVYKKANEKRDFKLFRFPYGDKGGKNKEKIQECLRKLGYSQKPFSGINYDYFKEYRLDKDSDVFWTFDTEDYKSDLPKILKHMEEVNPAQGGSLLDFSSKDIILMHDTKNKEKFFKIIEELEKRAIFEGVKGLDS